MSEQSWAKHLLYIQRLTVSAHQRQCETGMGRLRTAIDDYIIYSTMAMNQLLPQMSGNLIMHPLCSPFFCS